MPTCRISRSDRGFTLIELMVTIAVLSIILTIAFPSVRELVSDSNQASAINEFIGYLNYSRAEATKRGTPVGICASTNGADCGGTSWETGWVVYQDSDNSDSKDAGEPLLKTHGAVGGSLTIRAGASGNEKFNSRGIPSLSRTFTFCDGRGNRAAKAVSVVNSGRVRKGGTLSACP